MARCISLVTVVLALAAAAIGQTSDSRCRSDTPGGDPSSATYARRGSYCDGSRPEDNSGSGLLPVIGVTATAISGNPATKPLLIGVLGSGGGDPRPVQLQGVARSPHVNYRLDAVLSPPPLKIGPESAMTRIRPRPLQAEDIAWVAWKDLPDGRTYIPVVASGAAPRSLEIVVRPSIVAGYLVYSVTAAANGRVLLGETLAPGNRVPAEPVSLTIAPGEPRAIVVHVTAVAEDGETQVVDLRVTRPSGHPK